MFLLFCRYTFFARETYFSSFQFVFVYIPEVQFINDAVNS